MKCKKDIQRHQDYFESVDKPELKMHRNCFLTAKSVQLLRFTGLGGYNLKNDSEGL